MPAEESFLDLLAGLRASDDAAAAQVFHRYTGRLMALARNLLDSRIRSKINPEDVVQSVYKSFFRNQAEVPFDLAGWDGLWALFAIITVRKCGRWNRHFHTGGRSVAREVSAPDPGESSGAADIAGPDPTPDEVLMLTEVVEQLMGDLPEAHRPILTLALQGHSAADIRVQLDRSERTVYRVLERVRNRLEQLAKEGLIAPETSA